MDLRDQLYYVRQYREYNKAGIVPDVTCDEDNVPYMAKAVDDDIVMFCYVCGYEFAPGVGLVNEMVKYVREIEG